MKSVRSIDIIYGTKRLCSLSMQIDYGGAHIGGAWVELLDCYAGERREHLQLATPVTYPG